MSIADLLYHLYIFKNHRVRKLILTIITKIEAGELYSKTLRRIFKDYHNVIIGLYTHGGCFLIGQIDKFSTIGNYCSLASTVRVMNRNHPLDFKSTHAFFFNPVLNYCNEDLIDYIPLKIGNDVWIGHNAIIMPNVTEISTGAVIGAGAVVNKNIPPYAIVVGNPARVVSFRFSEKTIKDLLSSNWWTKPIEEIKPLIHEYQGSYEKISDE